MNTDPAMARLLLDALALQDEDGRGIDLDEDRVRDVLYGRSSFQPAEEHLLATSPLAREIFREVWKEVQVEREACRRRLQRAGVQTTTGVLLAAGSEHYPLLIPGSGDEFRVTVRPNPVSSGWIITLALGEKFRRNLATDDVLALVDDRNVKWLCGTVNEYGDIHSYSWPCNETPWERTRQSGFALRVQHA